MQKSKIQNAPISETEPILDLEFSDFTKQVKSM